MIWVETGNLVQGGAGEGEQADNLGGDHLDRGTANLDVEHNNNNVSLLESIFASLPAKVEELTKTVNAIKTSVDVITTKVLPDVAAPIDVDSTMTYLLGIPRRDVLTTNKLSVMKSPPAEQIGNVARLSNVYRANEFVLLFINHANHANCR